MDQQLSLFYGLSFLTAAAAFAFAVYLYLWVKKQPLVNKTIEEVAGLIRAGANTFMGREYKILAIFAIVIAVVLFVLLPTPVWKDGGISDNIGMAIAYLFGTVLSAIAGKIGLLVASLSNGRCAEAADKGIVPSFLIGYRGGSVMGLLVVGCALLGVSLVLAIVGDATILLGFSFGASSLALYAKAGGGIFTKTADVAADLTGKVELGIPEDDPRNPAVFSSMLILGVDRNAQRMVAEIHRQFNTIKGLREGKPGVKPEYDKCIDIATSGALRELLPAGGVAIIGTIVVGFIGGPSAVGGFLLGNIVSGLLLSLFMSNVGGLWDNSKKYVEAGNEGGKGSEAHKAAVIGDTVGDPFKDTAGPSINTQITVVSLVASLLSTLFVAFSIFG